MNRRFDERIYIKLACVLIFPSEWCFSVQGFTANIHRGGVLVACESRAVLERVPRLGSKAAVQVELPSHPAFSRKCIVCETTLVRVDKPAGREIQFALRIENVSFQNLAAVRRNLASMQIPLSSLPV